MNPDDPRLTAYALGELDAAGRAEIAQLLRENPVIAEEIEASRTFAEMLRLRLKNERAEPLLAGQRAEVLACAARATPRRPHAFPRQMPGWLALAAGVVLGIGIALLFPALNSLKVPPLVSGRVPGLLDGSDVRVMLAAEPAMSEETLVVLNEWPLEAGRPVFPNLHAPAWVAGRMAFNGGESVLHFDTKLPVIEFSPPLVAQNEAPVSTANWRNFSRQNAGARVLREARYATAPVPPTVPDWDTRAVERVDFPENQTP